MGKSGIFVRLHLGVARFLDPETARQVDEVIAEDATRNGGLQTCLVSRARNSCPKSPTQAKENER